MRIPVQSVISWMFEVIKMTLHTVIQVSIATIALAAASLCMGPQVQAQGQQPKSNLASPTLQYMVPGNQSVLGADADTAPIISQDAHYLYILRGDYLYKVQKSDLKVDKGRLPDPDGPQNASFRRRKHLFSLSETK